MGFFCSIISDVSFWSFTAPRKCKAKFKLTRTRIFLVFHHNQLLQNDYDFRFCFVVILRPHYRHSSAYFSRNRLISFWDKLMCKVLLAGRSYPLSGGAGWGGEGKADRRPCSERWPGNIAYNLQIVLSLVKIDASQHCKVSSTALLSLSRRWFRDVCLHLFARCATAIPDKQTSRPRQMTVAGPVRGILVYAISSSHYSY